MSENKDLLTIELLEQYIEGTYGLKLCYDVVTGEKTAVDLQEYRYETDGLKNVELPFWATYLSDELKKFGCSGCSTQRVNEFLDFIANKNKINSVKKLLDCLPEWDGTSRLDELYDILHIQDDELSKVFVKKWLMQCICMLENNEVAPYGCDGILVFQGKQGIGKTSFFRKLAISPQFFKDGQVLNPRDKDTVIACTGTWIVELGELESTFKSEMSALKAFITADKTEVRRPYDRNAIKKPRYTSFCGTCNSSEFLKDETGNRRFWVVPISKIDLKRLESFNTLQLWKEIQTLVGTNFQSFRLTAKEREELENRNGGYLVKLPAQEEIEDIFSDAQKRGYYEAELTVSDFKLKYSQYLGRYSTSQIGKALKALGIDSQPIHGRRVVKVKIHSAGYDMINSA